MNRTRKSLALLVGICLLAVATAGLLAASAKKEPEFSVNNVEPQTVLYTIHRGHYQGVGQTIGRLFATAGQKAIAPKGSVSFAYLNNPTRVSSEHWLTEIRIPVDKEALKLAGTLGEMTDIKTLPGTQVVATVKPEGMADPAPIYKKLFKWIYDNSYMPQDNASEVFVSNVTHGDYAAMKSQISVPVEKISKEKK